MATIKSHLARAEHNKALAEILREHNDYLDWHIVVLFYATLHKVQAMLRVAGYAERATDSHVKVKNILNSLFTDIGVDYTLLLSAICSGDHLSAIFSNTYSRAAPALSFGFLPQFFRRFR